MTGLRTGDGAAAVWLVGLALVIGSGAVSAEETSPRWLRHVVLFKFKGGTPDDKLRQIEKAFGQLPDKIPTIAGFEWGTNNSPEGLDQGFTHCFFVSFKDEAGRAAYLPHPAHQEFVALLRPHLETALVVDYWARTKE